MHTTQPEALQNLLEAVAAGQVEPADALAKLKHFDVQPVSDFARLDNHRTLRTGFPEVIWGEGKTPDQITQLIIAMREHHPIVMATRIDPIVYAKLQTQIPDLDYYKTARICALQNKALQNSSQPPQELGSQKDTIPQEPCLSSPANAPRPLPSRSAGIISILSAGTADLPVAEEAAITAELSGFQVTRLWDVGVAGIHRLLSNRHVVAEAQVLIVVAGMDGALPSVVAGLADCPVIAVPTSIGYGASFGGLAPLLTMLNSCAPGVGVVNIDNGFGAAILAAQILRTHEKMNDQSYLS